MRPAGGLTFKARFGQEFERDNDWAKLILYAPDFLRGLSMFEIN